MHDPSYPPPPVGPHSWDAWQGGPNLPPPGPVAYEAAYGQPSRSHTGPIIVGTVLVAVLGLLLFGALMTLGAGLGSFAETGSLASLDVGQCFNGGRPTNSPPDATALLGAIDVVDCRLAHDSELVGAFAYPSAPGASYPGTPIVNSYSEAECYVIFERYVGVPFTTSRYELTYVTPLEFNWSMNDKLVQCLVHPPAEQPLMTGTVRNSRR